MDVLVELARAAYDLSLNVWVVVAAAVILAWLQRNAQARKTRSYDAWWVHQGRGAKKR